MQRGLLAQNRQTRHHRHTSHTHHQLHQLIQPFRILNNLKWRTTLPFPEQINVENLNAFLTISHVNFIIQIQITLPRSDSVWTTPLSIQGIMLRRWRYQDFITNIVRLCTGFPVIVRLLFVHCSRNIAFG